MVAGETVRDLRRGPQAGGDRPLNGALEEAGQSERQPGCGPDNAGQHHHNKEERNPKQEPDGWEDQHAPF
jgi:hypothetical protein